MPQRKPHHKSKTGCLQCRRRKIKCDEEKPICSHCKRYSDDCTYPPPGQKARARVTRPTSTPLSDPGTPASSVSRGSGHPDSQRELAAKAADFSIHDMFLLHNWTVSACFGYGNGPADRETFQVNLPRMACNFPFLMHGLLAISALHAERMHRGVSDQYLVVAAHHQNMALPLYRASLSDVTETNVHAIVAFAMLTATSALASTPILGGLLRAESPPSERGMPEWLYLVRGAHGLMSDYKDWLRAGPMARAVRRTLEGHQPVDPATNPYDAHLFRLRPLFYPEFVLPYMTAEELDACRTTWHLLREVSAGVYKKTDPLSPKAAIFLWLELIPQDFFRLLTQRRAEALILLAHTSVLLQQCTNDWFLEGHAEHVLRTVYEVLHPRFRQWLDWPLSVVLPKAVPGGS